MKISIIDDIQTDIQLISKYIHTFLGEHCINMPITVDTFENGEKFLKIFKRDFYDVIFLDYYMDSLSGLDTAFAIRQSDCNVKIIFTTASRDYAIDSYKVKASGYLVKPISYEEFSEIMSLINFQKIKDQNFIQITNGYNTVKIPLHDIVYCDISGHYVQIHTLNLGIQRSRMTFDNLKTMLRDYAEFLLCYRGCMINMNHIDHVENLIFFLDNGEQIPLCQKQHNEILKIYSEFLFDKVRNQI